MAVALGLVPALLNPSCPYVEELVPMPTQSAPMAMAQSAPSPNPISPQLAPMAVALEKPCYLAPRSPLLAPMAVAQSLGPALLEP